MGSLKKRRKAKIAKHKRRKRMKAHRHKKRLRYKAQLAEFPHAGASFSRSFFSPFRMRLPSQLRELRRQNFCVRTKENKACGRTIRSTQNQLQTSHCVREANEKPAHSRIFLKEWRSKKMARWITR